MGLNSDGSEPSGEPDQPKIPVHAFFAGCHEIVMGRLTVANLKTGLSMDSAAQSEFDAMIALAPTGSTALATAQKAQYVESIHSVFILAEGRYAGYSTAAQVRTKLGI
jgi:hypothetical protein